jgi:hypothetical protein
MRSGYSVELGVNGQFIECKTHVEDLMLLYLMCTSLRGWWMLWGKWLAMLPKGKSLRNKMQVGADACVQQSAMDVESPIRYCLLCFCALSK